MIAWVRHDTGTVHHSKRAHIIITVGETLYITQAFVPLRSACEDFAKGYRFESDEPVEATVQIITDDRRIPFTFTPEGVTFQGSSE